MSLKEFKSHLQNIFAPSTTVKTELYLATQAQDAQKVKNLLENISAKELNIVCRPPEPKEYSDINYETPRTAFVEACFQGNEKIINEFLKKPQLNINYYNYNGESALLVAAKHAPLNVVSTLINQEGINIHQVNRNNDNVLMVLAQRRKYDYPDELISLTKQLIDKGVNYHQQQFNDNHDNVFDIAIKNGKESLVNFFLSTDIKKQNDKENPLISAMKVDSFTQGHMTKILLNKGFDCTNLEKLINKLRPKEVGEHFNQVKEIVMQHLDILKEHNHLSVVVEEKPSLKDKIKNIRSNLFAESTPSPRNENKQKL